MFFFETLFLQFLPTATILSLPSLSLATKIATEVASAASYSSCINACNPGLVSLLQKSPLFFITSTTTDFQQKHIPNRKAYSFSNLLQFSYNLRLPQKQILLPLHPPQATQINQTKAPTI